MNHDNISQENAKYDYKPRRLPHKFDDRLPVFITFRLKFTLPEAMMQVYNEKRTKWYADYQKMDNEGQSEALLDKDQWFFKWFDELLATTDNIPQILDRPDLTEIIAGSLRHFDQLWYTLIAFCIMPNHVYVLMQLKEESPGTLYSPQHILYSWKKFSAGKINAALGRQGSLWQKECYDHLVRDIDELNRIVDYIVQNPVKAGLAEDWKQWKGTYLHRDYMQIYM